MKEEMRTGIPQLPREFILFDIPVTILEELQEYLKNKFEQK